jgi:DNA repair protein RadA/Sms
MKYVCTNCGAEFLKWEGRCSSCGEWETVVEMPDVSDDKSPKTAVPSLATSISKLSKTSQKNRISTGFDELDRVLGGGLVPGGVILLAGEPGIGKSTLLLQVGLNLAKKNKVLYVAGEESPSQLFTRLKRIEKAKSDSKSGDNLVVTEDTNVENISALIKSESFGLVIVDSIQSMVSSSSRSYAGSVGQVRVSGAELTRVAKRTETPIVIVGQITKEGNIAGPKVLEHVVDTVISFEGGEFNTFRIVRTSKNRFGATNEIGVFEMKGDGLSEVGNPSQAFLEGTKGGPGSAVGAVLKGSRVVFVEVQALVAERGADFGPLRRVANGIKKPRLDMLCAVLSRRGGVYLGDKDVFVNVVGGISVDDPALDLAICAAIKAAVDDVVLDRKTLYWGEVGLTGEVRSSFSVESVMNEASRVGYKTAVAAEKGGKSTKLQVKKMSTIKNL